MDSSTGQPTGGARRPGGAGKGDMGGHVEIEHKYDVDPGFAVPDLAGIPGVTEITGPQTHQLTAVYFDTPDRLLLSSRITLRRRSGGADAGWHLKLPAGEGARREVHAPLGNGSEPVPAELAEIAAGRTGARQLVPVARLETTRTVSWLKGSDGRILAEIADDRVTGSLPSAPGSPLATGADTSGTGAGADTTGTGARADTTGTGAEPEADAARTGWDLWREAATWREIEVELAEGPAHVLDAVGDRLRRAGAMPSAAASKLGRLLSEAGSPPGAAPQAPPSVIPPGGVPPDRSPDPGQDGRPLPPIAEHLGNRPPRG